MIARDCERQFLGRIARLQALVLLPAIGLLLTAGCGSANPLGRVSVSGQVTLDGKPLDRGVIEFAPVTASVGSGTTITAGHYSLETARGLPPGRYQVRIYAPVQAAEAPPRKAAAPPGSEAGGPTVERVASRFNATTTLTAEVPSEVESLTLNFQVFSQ